MNINLIDYDSKFFALGTLTVLGVLLWLPPPYWVMITFEILFWLLYGVSAIVLGVCVISLTAAAQQNPTVRKALTAKFKNLSIYRWWTIPFQILSIAMVYEIFGWQMTICLVVLDIIFGFYAIFVYNIGRM